MDIKRGIAVSPGVAIGPALVLDTEWFRIPQRFVEPEQVEDEIARVRQAFEDAARETREMQDTVNAKLGVQYGAIFGAHALMLSDPALQRDVDGLIRERAFAAEYAVHRVMRRYAQALESIEAGHLASRVSDISDLEKRIVSRLLGQRREQLGRLREPVVALAHDLTPSETASLDPRRVHAFATEAGGRTSHTAIVAGVLEIPAVVGLGPFTADVSDGAVVIVDGNQGLLIIDPDEETLAQYRAHPPQLPPSRGEAPRAARPAGRHP